MKKPNMSAKKIIIYEKWYLTELNISDIEAILEGDPREIGERFRKRLAQHSGFPISEITTISVDICYTDVATADAFGLNAIVEREETDKEFEERQKKIEKWKEYDEKRRVKWEEKKEREKARIEEHERKMYLKLKEKFENG